MWRRSAVVFLLLAPAAVLGQSVDLPPGPLREKARAACMQCHDARIIVQQRLEPRVWAKVVDKMIRWGAPVAAEDREALIDYFAQHFGPREDQSAAIALPPDEGAEKVRAACLGCHDAGIIAQQQLNRRGWARVLDKMARWEAHVREEDREVILRYLSVHFTPPAKDNKKEEKPK